MRYAVSGANTSAIEPATGAVRSILGRNIPTGRVFWLRWINYISSSTYGALLLYDATAGATVGSGTLVASLTAVLAGDSGQRNFGAPGLKFLTGCCCALEASGAIAIGKVSGGGYEE